MKAGMCSVIILGLSFLTGIIRAEDPDFGNDYTVAHPLATDGSITEGLISDKDDADWFSFSTSAYGLYEVSLTTYSSYKYARIYSLSGVELSLINPPSAFYVSSGTTSKTVFFPQAGTYYVEIYTTHDNYTGIYQISINESGTYPPDSYSDTCIAPEPLTVDAPAVTGTITNNGNDEDWFTFATTPLHKYEIIMTRPDSSNRMYYELYDDDCGSRIQSQRYTAVTIMSWFGESYDIRLFTSVTDEGWYSIQVLDIADYTDDYGNEYADATVVPADGTPTEGSLQYKADINSDTDWFSFDSSEYGLYNITLSTLSGNKTIKLMHLIGPDQLEQIISFSSSSVLTKTVYLQSAETYFLEVSGSTLGTYQVALEELGTIPPDDYPDVCSEAPGPFELVVDDDPTEGTLSTELDTDWFTFEAERLHKYDITLSYDDIGTVRYDLYAGDCLTRLRQNIYQMTLVAWEDGNYNLRVHTTQGLRYYAIQVTDMGLQPDDHGNTAEDATPILPNGHAYPGISQYSATLFSDEDWFAFTAPYDSTYDVTLNSQSSTKYLYVYEEEPGGVLTQVLYVGTSTTKTDTVDVKEQTRYFVKVSPGQMGSYTVTVQAPTPMCGDVAHPFPTYDFNLDCYVNMGDLAMFALDWLQCTDPNPPCAYNP